MESKKLRVFLKVIFLNLIFVSYISAENITTAPLINLDEIQPTYDEDSIDTTANNEVNSIKLCRANGNKLSSIHHRKIWLHQPAY